MKHPLPEAARQDATAYIGKTGSGKSSSCRTEIEDILHTDKMARVCILDPRKSDWWGITSSPDGKKPGLPFYILGGPHGHVPLHSGAGKAIGELVATGGLPLSIIDMKYFEPGGLHKFFNEFAPALMRRMRGVLYLVMEEAHEFAPKERFGIGNENLSVYWAKSLATAGRSQGIRLRVITQRTQQLHNSLFSSCETMAAHRIIFPGDQEPVLRWFRKKVSKEFYKEIAASMDSLPKGAAWVVSGEVGTIERVQFPRITTYDNSRTPDGSEAAQQIRTAPVDEEKLRSIIGDAVKAAEADEPKVLRKQIVELTRQRDEALRAKAPAAVSPAPAGPTQQEIDDLVSRAEEAAMALGRHEGRVEYAKDLLMKIKELEALGIKDLAKAIDRLAAALEADTLAKAPKMGRPRIVASSSSSAHSVAVGRQILPIVSKPRASAAAAPEGITGPQFRLLGALSWWSAKGIVEPRRPQLAAIAKWVPSGSNLKDRLSELKRGGYIEYPREGFVRLTEAGSAIAPAPDASATMIDGIREVLTGPQKMLFNALLHLGGRSDRASLAGVVGWEPNGSNLKDRLSELSRLEVVTYPEKGVVEIADWLAEETGDAND